MRVEEECYVDRPDPVSCEGGGQPLNLDVSPLMSKQYVVILLAFALVGCTESTSFARLENIDRIAVGPYAFKQSFVGKVVEIRDKHRIEEITAIVNPQLAKPWKSFIGMPGTSCNEGVYFFSRGKHLGTLSFATSAIASRMAITPMPNPTGKYFSGLLLLEEDASAEIEALRRIIGFDNLQGICPEKAPSAQVANGSFPRTTLLPRQEQQSAQGANQSFQRTRRDEAAARP